MRSKLIEIRTHVLEFILFLLATLTLWGDADLCRYLITHQKPTEHQFLWVVAIYAVVWTIAGLLRDLAPGVYKRIQTLELSQQPAIEQQPEA